MDEPANWLLFTRLRDVVARLGADASGPAAESAWQAAEAAVEAAGVGEDVVVALPVLERDRAALEEVLEGWQGRRLPLTAWDQAVLKRAMNAFKKRLKLTRADDEVTSNRNPLSRGVSSSITGVRPPEQYTEDIWRLLLAHGRVRDGGDGLLEQVME